MNFLNPLALFGLIAASIPVIIHLLNLRKLKTVEFSTLRFLKELQKTKIRRLKLKQLLLLLLRTLIIIFAVLALSRPATESTLPFIGSFAQTSTIIIIDNSFSMDVSDEFGNRFNQAKNHALTIISALKEGDEAIVIEMAGRNNLRDKQFTRNHALLAEEISKIKVSNATANLINSLRYAEGLFEEAQNLNKEIFVISDAQPNTLANEIDDSLKVLNSSISLFVVPVGLEAQSEIVNLSIDSVNVNTQIFQKDKLVETEALIRNHSEKDIEALVVSMFFNDARVAQRTIDIPANEVRTLPLAAVPQTSGVQNAFIELESDALDVDNRRYFGFVIPDRPKTAIIGPAKSRRIFEYALGIDSDIQQPAVVSSYNPTETASIDFSNFDLLIIVGGPLKASDFDRISQYVQKGGGLLIFADENTAMNVLSDGLSKLGIGDVTAKNYDKNQPAVFSNVDKLHPIFEGVFKGSTDGSKIVETARVFKALVNNGGQKIIEMPGGAFLSESKHGDGKVLYCSAAPNTDWSTFPVTGLFPVLIYRSVYYLSAQEGNSSKAIVGQPLTLLIPKKYSGASSFRVIDPNKTEFFKQAVVLPSGAVLSFDNLERAGLYRIYTQNDKIASMISVNTDPSESVIINQQADALDNALTAYLNEETSYIITESNDNIIQNVERARTGTELWQLFVLLAILTAIAEMLVARNTKSESMA